MQDNISFEILYKPERLLMKKELEADFDNWIKSIKIFITKQENISDNTYRLLYSSQQKKFLATKFNNAKIIGDNEYENCSPKCIYYLKGDIESENELKKLNTQIKSIDIKGKIETPEWTNNETIFDGEYVAEKCNDTYIFSKSDDINILNNMLSLEKPIFIIGERGSGKTTIVQNFIKKTLDLPDEKFISIACGTLDPNLAKSELFGHVKGAFTGAENDKTGAIENANKGCLYLDEIQDLSKEIQRMLIKAIEEHKFSKVGSTKIIKSDFLLVCSSNKPLTEIRKLLYEDFYDRISFFQYKIKSVEEQKKADKEFISKCIPIVWRNYREKCSSQNQFLVYNQLDSYNSKSQKYSIKERIIAALNKQYLSGNYRDIEKLLGYIELYALNTKIFSSSPDNEQINKNIDLAINKWEEYLKERDAATPELSEAFIEKQTWEGINKMFRKWIATQAVEMYGSATAAANALKVDKNSILKATKF